MPSTDADRALKAYVLATLAARQVYGKRYESDAQWLDRLRTYVQQHHEGEFLDALADIHLVDSAARKMVMS